VEDADREAQEIRNHIEQIDAQIHDLRERRTDMVRRLASVWARV
jgi:chorismate mutase